MFCLLAQLMNLGINIHHSEVHFCADCTLSNSHLNVALRLRHLVTLEAPETNFPKLLLIVSL